MYHRESKDQEQHGICTEEFCMRTKNEERRGAVVIYHRVMSHGRIERLKIKALHGICAGVVHEMRTEDDKRRTCSRGRVRRIPDWPEVDVGVAQYIRSSEAWLAERWKNHGQEGLNAPQLICFLVARAPYAYVRRTG
jgi:hypothetical protein